MSKMTIFGEVGLNDGLGNKLPIQTGTWVSGAINIEEQRRLSVTIGVQSATGAAGDIGGFTGTLLIQGTNELAQRSGYSGTADAGNTTLPGTNGATGALYWNTIPSGTIAITNALGLTGQAIELTDVGPRFIRFAFNRSATGPIGTNAQGGSGTMKIFYTIKNT